MRIKFTHDFRGKLTRERYYLAGTELDIDDDTGAELIALEHAVKVDVAAPVKAEPVKAEAVREPEPEPKAVKRGKSA